MKYTKQQTHTQTNTHTMIFSKYIPENGKTRISCWTYLYIVSWPFTLSQCFYRVTSNQLELKQWILIFKRWIDKKNVLKKSQDYKFDTNKKAINLLKLWVRMWKKCWSKIWGVKYWNNHPKCWTQTTKLGSSIVCSSPRFAQKWWEIFRQPNEKHTHVVHARCCRDRNQWTKNVCIAPKSQY